MSISYPNQQPATQTAITRTPDLPLVLPMVYSPSFPLVAYGTNSQKIANALIPPSSSYNLSGSSYNIVAVLSLTGALNATASLAIEPLGFSFQLSNSINMITPGEIRYYGEIPVPFNNHADPGTALELYMSGSDSNLTCSLHKFEMVFNTKQ
jgi:hypothetical protein